jgi:hypothetical protein
MAVAQFDAETRFHVRAVRGNARRGVALLDRLDHASGSESRSLNSRKPKG